MQIPEIVWTPSHNVFWDTEIERNGVVYILQITKPDAVRTWYAWEVTDPSENYTCMAGVSKNLAGAQKAAIKGLERYVDQLVR